MKRLICLFLLCAVLVILAGCGPSEYDVIVHLTDISVTGDSIASVKEGFHVTLEADELYRLPQSVEITVDGEPLSADDYSYDSQTGELSIPGKAITGEVNIRATAELLFYTVTVDSTSGIHIQGQTLAYPQQDYKATLVPDEFYLLPETVDVRVAGQSLDTQDYLYDASTGELVITADITSDVTVSAEANPIVYDLTVSSLGVTISYGDTQTTTQAVPAFGLTATLVCTEGYELPQTVEVFVNGSALDASSYSYEPLTGKLAIPGKSITGALEIRAVGAAEIVGQWQGSLDVTSLISEDMASGNSDMGEYVHFHDLVVEYTFSFREDGTASLSVDESSGKELLEKLKAQIIDGMKLMLQELLDAQGLNMDVDTYLALVGMDLNSMFDDTFNFDSMGFDALETSGMYLVDGTKLYLFDPGETYNESEYLTYILDGDSLSLEIGSGDSGSFMTIFFPATLTRAPQ